MPSRIRRPLGSCLAMVVFAIVFYTSPLLALAIGWIGWDWQTGAQAALIVLVTLVSLAAGMLILLREPSAWEASFPILFGIGYALLPDLVILSVDDGLVFSLGALLSFLLWRKRRNDIPTELLLPILAASAYTFVGGFIPGPFDELLVYLLTGGVAWWIWNRVHPSQVESNPALANSPRLDAGQPFPLQPAFAQLGAVEIDGTSPSLPQEDRLQNVAESRPSDPPTQEEFIPIEPFEDLQPGGDEVLQ